ncbi:hypothetical protein HBI56_066130 [Parastagonospora nodorum]|nr:hypothetical protein HBH53_210040 [Parastagonospora nodorum]KAH3958467.1 hypothetical protein HBH51_208570 [Parastagonospora nodorum]KAH4001432.1 hypothetical protein HBI10_091220 [Parastagonospora nodorum]KAH4027514.1 hypothetical protein HBI13_060240 [Parastagonospora nodorum]KAH4035827.1 hypothetical protein HBI09_092380 [Parastagonospora nodorum]
MHALLYAAGLQNLVLLPGSPSYIDRQSSYWAANTPLHPKCIVQPRTTEQVSLIIKTLAKVKGPLAIRSGGHTQWAGSNDVHDGVTIDLGEMAEVKYDNLSKLASIQPGSRWGNVFQELLKQQVCVAGGRDGNVGVGGFLTGGGNSFFSGLYGFGCDNVANFEVVLASGDIINANSSSHRDLWIALKGGSGNFGIVTRFDMYTFPAHDLWGGVRASMRSEGDALAQTMVDFTNGNDKDPQAAFMLSFDYNPAAAPAVFVTQLIVNTNGSANGSTFEQIEKIPAVADDIKERSMASMATSYSLPSGRQQNWFSLTFKNDVKIIKRVSAMHDELAAQLSTLITPQNFSTSCLFQPMPKLIAQHSTQRGGNVMGLDQVKENALLWSIVGSTQTPAEHAIMREKLLAFVAAVEAYAMSEDLNVDWRYLNYVDSTQDPLKSYGQKNVDFMRDVAAKYDPSGMFQKKIVSGWKISKVDAQP